MEADKKIAAAMVGLGACARIVPHPWNFTPMMAIGLYAGAKSAKLRVGIFATLAALLASDAILGFYHGMWYIYAASLVPVLLGRFLRRKDGAAATAAVALVSSLSFFIITNFMVWATGALYPHTFAGLATCFAAAVPFYQNEILGDAFYTVALFGGHALLRRFAQPAPQAA
ncbi:MAG TPA: DUF6580 family putative transport protein [Bryobacteraceae bacterium]|nr:DUF6580 family putative transport protein [Bryobacteraceae bacterium]